MKNRIIIVTGPKHSGKTLCVRALGKITQGEAVDLDEVLEKEGGKTPRELFKEGPEIFRKAEALALASLIRQSEGKNSILIIAAGGGLIDNTGAMALISRREEIITVYLDVSPETAWQRILCATEGGELPPFLNTGNPRETHHALHKRRAEAYKALARLTVDAENKSPEEIAGEIADRLAITGISGACHGCA